MSNVNMISLLVYLLVQILECTAEGHADRGPLKEALERAEELCQQVLMIIISFINEPSESLN